MNECSVSICTRKAERRGLCNGHYLRLLRNGSPGESPIQVYGRQKCGIDGCDRPHVASGLCSTHHKRRSRTGDPGDAAIAGPAHTYVGMHLKVARKRGRAADHVCEDCGSGATDWAYDHSDPDQLYRPEYGSPYSLDVDRYRPLCRDCHIAFDLAAKAAK